MITESLSEFFGWLQQPRPQGGPRRRMEGCNQTRPGVDEDQWYNKTETHIYRERAVKLYVEEYLTSSLM